MIVKQLIWASIAGSICYFIWKMIDRTTGKWIPPVWMYRWLLLVQLVYLIPFCFFPVKQSTVFQRLEVVAVEKLPVNKNIVSNGVKWTMLFWAVGVFFSLAYVFWQLIRLWQKRKTLTQLTDEELLKTVRILSGEYSLKGLPQILIDPNILLPYTGGIWKPFLAVPEDINGRKLWMLEHEIYHIKRKDVMYRYLNRIICTIFWFCPTVYFQKKDLCLFCEIACDQKVLEKKSDREKIQYFRSILDCMNQNRALDSHSCGFQVSGKPSMLRRRVEYMMRKKQENKKKGLLIGCCMGIAVAGTVFAVSNMAANPKPVMEKLIRNNYTADQEIPKSVTYTEYMDGAWWGGPLQYKSVKYLPSSGLYQATYQGELVPWEEK